MDDLKSNTPLSSMRVNNRIITYAVCFLIAGILFHICMGTINHTSIDWNGLGTFTLAIAGLVTGTYGAKAYQSKHEKKDV